MYMRDASRAWLWVAVKYVSAGKQSEAPAQSSGHSASFNYHLDQPVLQRVAAAAADIFMREDESLVAAVMSNERAFQAVRHNILHGEPWFKDTHNDGGLLDNWMRALHSQAQVPDVLPLASSEHCGYSVCLGSAEWLAFPCDLWTRVFMSCHNGSASHADLRTQWRLRGGGFTAAKAHSIWFKLPSELLVQPAQKSDLRAAARQSFVDGMLGASAMRRASLSHAGLLRLLQGKRLMMVGDSNMRFQYLDLAYFICFGIWPSLSEDSESLVWLWRVSYLWDHDHAYSKAWHENFLMSTAAFRGLQQCDCFRPNNRHPNWKRMSFEGRVTRCNGVVLEYHQFFGPPSHLTGRLPLHAPAFINDISGELNLKSVCNDSSSCLGDGRFLWGGGIMDCVPPGVTAFDVLPPCSPPWQMDLVQFLMHVGSTGGGVDLLLLNYGAQSLRWT
jgi:hypothetical protein